LASAKRLPSALCQLMLELKRADDCAKNLRKILLKIATFVIADVDYGWSPIIDYLRVGSVFVF
jgi:hypothetical protein